MILFQLFFLCIIIIQGLTLIISLLGGGKYILSTIYLLQVLPLMLQPNTVGSNNRQVFLSPILMQQSHRLNDVDLPSVLRSVALADAQGLLPVLKSQLELMQEARNANFVLNERF